MQSLALLALLACTVSDPVDDGAEETDSPTTLADSAAPTDSGTTGDTDTTDTDSGTTDTDTGSERLFGTFPAVALAAPEVTALNFDGTERTRDDLLGQPTVLWFYPAAGTAG